MAVLIEGISVVVRADAILSRFSGGWTAFSTAVPNETLCADGELARVGFMVPADTKAYVETLARGGLVYVHEGRALDLVVVDQMRGMAMPCDWAEVGTVPWEADVARPVGACRMVASKSSAVVVPPGWTYERSLTTNSQLVPDGWVPEFMDYLRTENGVEVYRDLRTGKDVYVGRTKGKA